MAEGETVELRVEGARKRDAGRGIARLPERARTRLGVLSGDPVIVEGDHLTVAKVWPGEGANDAVRIDADTRENAGVTIGDTVLVHGTEVEEAGAVTLQPTGEAGAADVPEDTLARRLRDRLLRRGERLRVGEDGPFVVTATTPSGSVRVTDTTAVHLDPTVVEDPGRPHGAGDPGAESAAGTSDDQDDEPATETPETGPSGTTYEDIGGLDDELDLVREMIELPLAEPAVFEELHVEPPTGVLLYGPPGSGKTLIARAVANEVDASFRSISGPEIVSKYKGESEERLREAFEAARAEAPAILFIDEIDSIAGSRDEEADMENRVVAQLLTLMDGLDTTGEVVVIGATNRVDSVDEALRRGGRFDREIEIGVPDEGGRREILAVHTRGMPLGEDVDIDRVAARTHGFVGADIDALVKEAAMAALRRDVDDLRVTRADFETALAAIEPSAMREYVAEAPQVDFSDVGGVAEAKARLREAVEWPLEYTPLFERTGTAPPTGILLYGPPGSGKTLLARATAGESGVNFLRVAGPELLDRYVGESEKAVRELFERARQTAPAIVFLDELDAVAARRNGNDAVTERVVSQLLTELDTAAENPQLVVIGATNRRDAIDPALLRPGRFEREILVPDPDEDDRRAILAVHVRGKPLAQDVDLDALAARTEGLSGAELEALVREASLRAIRAVARDVSPAAASDHADAVTIEAADFEAAVEDLTGPD